jgi:hypothetical protein
MREKLPFAPSFGSRHMRVEEGTPPFGSCAGFSTCAQPERKRDPGTPEQNQINSDEEADSPKS